MVTRFLFVVAVLFIQAHLYSQQWVRTYYLNNNANTNCIIETCDHGYLIDAWLNTGNNNVIRLLKTDINGYTLWEKQIGLGSSIFYSVEIEQTTDGGYILCGSTTKYSDSYDAFIMKLNACSEIEWCKILITPGNYDISIKVGITLKEIISCLAIILKQIQPHVLLFSSSIVLVI